MKSAVVPVVDDVGSTEEGVAENGALVVGDGTERAGLVVGLGPDEVVVRSGDDGVAELEVNGAVLLGDSAVNVVLAGAGVELGGGESSQKLVEGIGREGAQGVAGVEEESLGRVENGGGGAILSLDVDAVALSPVADAAIGRGDGGNDVLLDKGTLELLGVNTTEDGGTAVAVDVAEIERESTAVDELLEEQVVQNVGEGAVPGVQVRTDTEDTSGDVGGVLSDTESLLVNPGGCGWFTLAHVTS